MAGLKYILPVVLLLSACGSAEESDPTPVGTYRAEVMADLALTEPIDPYTASVAARDFVSSKVMDSSTEPKINRKSRSAMHDLYVKVKGGQERLQCSGMALVMQFMLEEIGVPVRSVILASEDFFTYGRDYPNSSHVTVEANGVVLDPYFNASFQCGGVGDLLSTDQMVQCGNNVAPVMGPYPHWQRPIPADLPRYLYATMTF